MRPRTPDGQRIYAIGDVHGRSDLLKLMMGMIAANEANAPAADTSTLVFLGDYIDRGPDSRGVLDILIAAGSEMPSTVFLRGNHEIYLLDALETGQLFESWMLNGGPETLQSYGLFADAGMRFRPGATEIRDMLRRALPPQHERFLRSLRTSACFGDYFFAHAGVRPGVSLDRQSDDDLCWIRAPFLNYRGDFGKIVVHGHTPTDEPDEQPNRIGIDTGAFFSNALTAVVLDGESRQYLSTGPRPQQLSS